jgi:hypothetical protein
MPAENKVGDIYLEKDASTCRAFWRPADGTIDVLLCSMNLGVYEGRLAVRALFNNLAANIAINLNQPAGSEITVQYVPATKPADTKIDRSQFACWTCTHPQAADARYVLSSYSEDDLMARLSPLGTPMFCCRVAAVGAVAR